MKEEGLIKPHLSRNIIAFSFLAQASREENDLISGLTPIFKPIAKHHVGERFEPTKFCEIVSELYGIKVHSWAVQELIPRMESAGLLRLINEKDSIREYIYDEINEEFNEVTEADIKYAINQFISFSRPILSRLGIGVDEQELEDSFLNQLIDMDFISIMLKPDRTKEDNLSASTLTLKKSPDVAEWEESLNQKSKIEVLSAAFIVDVYHKNPDLYDLLMKVTTGALLSEVVLNIQDPQASVKLDGLFVILDTSFLMSYLDLTSEESTIAAREICEILSVNGASLIVFDHTVDEIRDNLKAVIEQTKNGTGHRATARRMAATVAYNKFVTSAYTNLDALIEQSDIIRRVPPNNDNAFSYFTADDELAFENYLQYSKQLVRERDAKSIAATMRLRRGHKCRMGQISDCRYLFITENTSLVKKAQHFLKSRNLADYHDVPPAITEKYLAGLLWVLYGGKGKDLTRHLLMANCATALEPRNDVAAQMHKFLMGINQTQVDLFERLMTEERAGQYLMQHTLGDSTVLTADNVEEVLEKLKVALIEKHEIEKRKELAIVQEQHTEQLSEKDKIIEQQKEKVLESETESFRMKEMISDLNEKVELALNQHQELSQEVDASNQALKNKEMELLNKAERRAKRLEKRLELLSSGVFACILFLISTDLNLASFSFTYKAIYWSFVIVAICIFTWKVPDKLLKPWIKKLVRSYYLKYAREYGVTYLVKDE